MIPRPYYTAYVPVLLDAPAPAGAQFNYATEASDTAFYDRDLQNTSDIVILEEGQTEVDLEIVTRDPNIGMPATFGVVLSNAVNCRLPETPRLSVTLQGAPLPTDAQLYDDFRGGVTGASLVNRYPLIPSDNLYAWDATNASYVPGGIQSSLQASGTGFQLNIPHVVKPPTDPNFYMQHELQFTAGDSQDILTLHLNGFGGTEDTLQLKMNAEGVEAIQSWPGNYGPHQTSHPDTGMLFKAGKRYTVRVDTSGLGTIKVNGMDVSSNDQDPARQNLWGGGMQRSPSTGISDHTIEANVDCISGPDPDGNRTILHVVKIGTKYIAPDVDLEWYAKGVDWASYSAIQPESSQDGWYPGDWLVARYKGELVGDVVWTGEWLPVDAGNSNHPNLLFPKGPDPSNISGGPANWALGAAVDGGNMYGSTMGEYRLRCTVGDEDVPGYLWVTWASGPQAYATLAWGVSTE